MRFEAIDHRLRTPLSWVVTLFPLLVTFGFFVALRTDSTRDGAQRLLSENQPVELATAAVFLGGAVVAAAAGRRAAAHESDRLVRWFFWIMAVAMAFVAFEEVAWGQWLIGFDTPEPLEELNRQGELTLHNIGPLNGKSELPRVVFGLGGLVGIWMARFRRIRPIAPPAVLASWFVTVLAMATPDLLNDIRGVTSELSVVFDFLSELLELLIAMALTIWAFLACRNPAT